MCVDNMTTTIIPDDIMADGEQGIERLSGPAV